MNELDRLEAALADRYPIERPLGAGGMATVYLARDLKHNRQVAVKVLRMELAATIGAERFLREIEIAARLTHPHILPLHDSGEADGFLYYVMPYVEGESLRDRLTREPQLSVVDALGVTKEVADALSYAHSHNVVHRDIKPANILMHAGHALVADFGIARAMSLSTVDHLTATGAAIGTPAYMSPEQINAEPQLDNRSDIYSLGCVLYEMLAGQPPFSGPTVDSILRQHQVAEVPAMTTLRPQVPDGVVEIIDVTLAKTPADRYASAEALAEDLSLQIALATDPSGAISRVKPLTRRRWPVVGTLAAVGAVALLAAALGLFRNASRSNTPAVTTQRQITFVGNIAEASVSPQGEFLVYTTKDVDGTALMVQDLAGGSTIEIASSPDHILHPSWSPDGRRILAMNVDTAGGRLLAYPRLGGDPHPLPVFGRGRWSVDGRQVYSWLENRGEVQFYSVGSGALTRIATPDTSAWLLEVAQHPRGDTLAVVHTPRDGAGTSIWRLLVDSAQRFDDQPRDSASRDARQNVLLLEDATRLMSVTWAPAGDRLYYLRDDRGTYQLWKLRTAARGAAQGRPELLMSGLQLAGATSADELSLLSLTADGSQLFVVKGRKFSNLWSVRPRGDAWAVVPLTTGTAYSDAPQISPDGEWVAYRSTVAGRTNVFVAPAAGGPSRQLTHIDSVSGGPVWSPDGRSLAFGLRRGGGNHVATAPVQAPAAMHVFEATALSGNGTIEWAPGSEILYQRPSVQNFHFLNPDTEEERPLLSPEAASHGWLLGARYSPDGTRLGVNWNRIGEDQDGVYVISLVDGGQRRLATPHTASAYPIGWSADGRTVYVHWADRREVLALPADGGSPAVLTTLPFAADQWAATTHYGRWFVFASPEATGDVWVIENFDPER